MLLFFFFFQLRILLEDRELDSFVSDRLCQIYFSVDEKVKVIVCIFFLCSLRTEL